MLKYIVAVVAAALLAVSGYSFYLRNVVKAQAETLQDYETTIDTQDRAIKAAAAREKLMAKTLKDNLAAKAALSTKQKESNARLEKALAANADWASQPVPAAVADWLRKP